MEMGCCAGASHEGGGGMMFPHKLPGEARLGKAEGHTIWPAQGRRKAAAETGQLHAVVRPQRHLLELPTQGGSQLGN
jgi:hypothetical protein